MTSAGTHRSATLADVARLAGVSAMTVSRAINDADKVSVDTRLRVQRAMDELSYRPNPLARGLARGRSSTIGVVISASAQYGPGSTLLGIERAARAKGFGVAIAAIAQPDRDGVREAVLSLQDRRVDGLVVIAPFVSTAGALGDVRSATPVVVAEAGHSGEAPIVGVDQGAGARLATRHLLELGHSTVHHVAGPSTWIESRLRIEGWRQELARARAHSPEPVEGDWSAESGYRAGLRLLEDPAVTAIFASNDQMALGVLHALHDGGRAVPHDVSVVGFDDTPESAHFTPALTTVRQDFDRVGEIAVESLDLMIHDPAGTTNALHLLAPTLVVRASTCSPAVE